MSIWLITSVLLAEDDGVTLLGATVAEMQPENRAIVTPITLMATHELVDLVKSGKPLKAIWPGEKEDFWWDVQVTQTSGGVETVETVPQGCQNDRTIAQMMSVKEFLAASRSKLKEVNKFS